MKPIKILIIAIRLSLGLLFVYAGTQKFIPKPQPVKTEASVELPDHVVKIKSFIGGMKQSGYFWPFLGVVEILCGFLLLSQRWSLLGAFLLVPVTLNIFLFHLFLTTDDTVELVMTGIYLGANLFLIGYEFNKLKPIFLNQKSS